MGKHLSLLKFFKENIFWFLLFPLFLAGGLGISLHAIRILGAIIPCVSLMVLFLARRKLMLPKGFTLFFVTILLLSLNLIWSQGRLATLEYLLMMLGGGGLWLLFYNLDEKFRDKLAPVIVILGVIYGFSLLVNSVILPELPLRPWTLYLPGNMYRNHNHIGDIWAVVMLIMAYKLLTKPKWWHWAICIIGVYFLAISLSRSAYLALGIGVFYLFNKLGLTKKHKKIFILSSVVVGALFLYAAPFKSTLLARPYFGQALWGLIRWPLGVGVGNFGIVSEESQGQWWSGLSRIGIISSSTHNLLIEMISGMGILGLTFAVWLAYITWDIIKTPKTLLYSAIFLVIAVNFMFDTTYYIPTMLWLWFASLGVAQAGATRNNIA